MNIAVIPARLKSKRIKNKNIKLFFGKPIISYSIKLAKKSKIFDKIIVSTDSKKIMKIAKKYGAEVPFFRPKKLSTDFVGTPAVINHAVKWCLKKKIKVKFVCCIYPTTPLLKTKYLVEGFNKIKKNKWNFVFSASRHAKPIQRSFYLNKKKGVNMFMPKFYFSRSQVLKDAYFDSGSFYWGKKDSWQKSNPLIFSSNSTIVEIPNANVQDLDTVSDWKKLSEKFKKIKNRFKKK